MKKATGLRFRLTSALLVLLGLSACGGGGSSTVTPGTSDDSVSSAVVRLAVPSAITNASGVVQSAVYPVVSVNGQALEGFERESAAVFSQSDVGLQGDATNTFIIEWYETYQGQALKLGQAREQRFVAFGETPITVSPSEFVREFDADNDSITNLDERIAGADPFVADGNEGEGNATLTMNVQIPNVSYSHEPEVRWKWGPVGGVMEKVSATNYRVYVPSRAAGEQGATEVKLIVDDKLVADVINSAKTLSEGSNTLSYQPSDFTFKSIEVTLNATIPDRSYPDGVKVEGLAGSTSADMNLKSDLLYSITIGNRSLGSSAFEARLLRKNDGLLYGTARKNAEVKIGTNRVAFAAGDFDLSVDTDGDGVRNIDDADPNTATPVTADVHVAYNSSAAGEAMDGVVGPEWQGATTRDQNNNPLLIDNVMYSAGNGGERNPEDSLSLMHDGQHLYVLVKTTDAAWLDDGPETWHDDAIELFWDGDNSKGSSYDKSNDAHVIITRVERYQWGSKSYSEDKPSGMFWGVNCTDGGACYYEVRIPLEGSRIGTATNAPFGFDVKLHDDDDGGEGDNKRGWYHPAGSDSSKPSQMGTLVLQ